MNARFAPARAWWARGLGVLLALVLMEAVTRLLYGVTAGLEPGVGWVDAVRWRVEGDGLSHWNRQGVRLTGNRLPGPAGPPILAVGHSHTEALQVNDDEVFSSVLERLLSRGLAAPVFNIGCSDLIAPDLVGLAPDYLREFHPRWVVVTLTPESLEEGAWRLRRDNYRFVPASGGRLALAPPATPLLERIRSRWARKAGRWFTLPNYLYSRLDAWRAYHEQEPPLFYAATEQPREQARYPIEQELDLLAQAYRGRLTLVLLPRPALQDPQARPLAERRFDAHCARRGWSCVNLRRRFAELLARGLSPYGFTNRTYNSGHLNRWGHEEVGRDLAAELRRLAARGVL